MNIRKRNGESEEYNPLKIKHALDKAFKACSYSVSEDVLDSIINDIEIWEDIEVEDIQNQIEEVLYDYDYPIIAKAYISYRVEHAAIRESVKEDIDFIESFAAFNNTADSTIDDNSNVSSHSIGVLNAEIHKKKNQDVNMSIWMTKIHDKFPEISIKQVKKDFDTIMYPHDSSSQILEPYCMACSMYPMLTSGLAKLGGKSTIPKSLEAFCGIYINLVFALSSEIKGAVATPEVLMYFDHFAKKEWGDDYYLKSQVSITTAHCLRQKTIKSQIIQYFEQITYSINQIAGSRGMQSPFTNFSMFDKYFFEGMFGEFIFPDGCKPSWESVNWLQKAYLHWLNQERLRCVLTFPVCSYAVLTDEDGNYKDKETFEFICQEYSEGNSFFLYQSSTVDSLSSCCRLRNSINDNTFNFTNGQIGVMTGSKNVITLNLNRIIQDWYNLDIPEKGAEYNIQGIMPDTMWINNKELAYDTLKHYLVNILSKVYKYHEVYNDILCWEYNKGWFPAYKAGFINLDKQYLTIGINGLNQAAEFLGINCNDNEAYKEFCTIIFETIKKQNTLHKTKKLMFNTEQTPCESAAIKLYNRDAKDGYWTPEDTNLYASYIFKPNDQELTVFDKIKLHSKEFASNSLDGGSACHINLSEHLSKTQYETILTYAAKVGCPYLTFNVPNTECEDCHWIGKSPVTKCPKCNSTNLSYYDRIIGYLTKINNWSSGRQIEQRTRIYNSEDKIK